MKVKDLRLFLNDLNQELDIYVGLRESEKMAHHSGLNVETRLESQSIDGNIQHVVIIDGER